MAFFSNQKLTQDATSEAIEYIHLSELIKELPNENSLCSPQADEVRKRLWAKIEERLHRSSNQQVLSEEWERQWVTAQREEEDCVAKQLAHIMWQHFLQRAVDSILSAHHSRFQQNK